MRVDFYQLSRDPAEQVAVALARRVVDGSGRLLVVSADRRRLDQLSVLLWSAGPDSYLANDHADAARPDAQMILLSDQCDPLNGARHLLLADGVWRDDAASDRFDRVFLLFDEVQTEDARGHWRTVKAMDGVEPHFWRQEGGRWVQVA